MSRLWIGLSGIAIDFGLGCSPPLGADDTSRCIIRKYPTVPLLPPQGWAASLGSGEAMVVVGVEELL